LILFQIFRTFCAHLQFQLLGSGMSNKMWESTVEHARECVLDDRLYSYCSGHGIVLLFNCVYEVVGVVVGSHCFTLAALTPTQKVINVCNEHDGRSRHHERLLTGRTLLRLQALVAKLQQDAYKFPDRIAEFKVQSQSSTEQQAPAAVIQAPPAPVPVPAAQMLGLPHGVVQPCAAGSHDSLLLSPQLLQHQQQPLSEAQLEDVLQSASAAEPWFPPFGAAGGFDARDPFDVQFSGSQPCGLLLSSTGARL
jgi:hypothetical protein